MSKQRKMILIAAAVGIISMFLPWLSLIIGSVNGMHGNGIIVFLGILTAGAVAFLGDQTTNLNKTNWMIALIAGGVASLFMIINFFDAMKIIGHMSIGFWGALLASLAIVAFTFMYRSADDSLQTGFDSLKNSFNSKVNTPQPGSTNDPTRPTV